MSVKNIPHISAIGPRSSQCYLDHEESQRQQFPMFNKATEWFEIDSNDWMFACQKQTTVEKIAIVLE
uniref:Uncharacterized protein n=1 Tax=Arion vulgaris TaxID=1028688 RepID=A0A0B6ZH74_9EUPU